MDPVTLQRATVIFNSLKPQLIELRRNVTREMQIPSLSAAEKARGRALLESTRGLLEGGPSGLKD